MANLFTRVVNMDIVWRQCGGDTYYGDFMVKLFWTLSVVFMEETWLIKLPDNLHINFTIKSRLKVSLSILTT